MAQNTTDNPQPTNHIAAIAILGALGLLAMVVIPVYIQVGHVGDFVGLHRMIIGQAPRPWAYRVLVPRIIGWLSRLPMGVILDNPALGAAARRVGGAWPAEGAAAVILLYLALVAALLGLVVIMLHYRYSWLCLALAPLLAVAGLLSLVFTPQAFIYDIPTWALWTWAIIALARRRDDWYWYLILFALANMCKETSVLLFPVWLVATWQYRNTTDWPRRMVEQLAVMIVTRGLLLAICWANPGAVAEWHLPDHLGAPWWLWGLLGGILLAMVALIARGWYCKPIILRRGLLVVAPPMIVLYLLFGFPGETRVFLELTPLVIPLLWRPQNA